VVGGINGFGKIVSSEFLEHGCMVRATGRNAGRSEAIDALYKELGRNDSATNPYGEFAYDLTKPGVPPTLLDHIATKTDILVLNATKTLDEDESVWNTTLGTFNKSLVLDRITVNLFGYVEFLNHVLRARWAAGTTKPMVVVYVDANESKFDGKMVDGKHLELNVAKAAVKQVFYTNAKLFTKLNMAVLCYDPGWLSLHGVSIEKKRAHSSRLIPPTIAARGIIKLAAGVLSRSADVVDEPIHDCSVYEFIK
jgi:NAD(P)-dependent dehydrogenase (short-subunit alcohol dehydrogenase family)